jgi:hypothetical protein
MASKKTGHLEWLLVPALWGLGVFYMFTGGSILNPSFTSWIWRMGPYPQTGWLGWQFFRQTPLWQWPLGSLPNYGAGLDSSLLFTDPIPLMALIFKPFSPWLPAEFQYFGLWVLICCPLQDAATLQRNAFGYQGERLIFSTGGNADQYTRLGWSDPELQARWTNGNEATLTLNWSQLPPGDLELIFVANALVTASHPVQRASFWVNGQRLAEHRFELGQPTRAISLPIPRKWAVENNGKLDLRIQLPDAIFPEDAGLKGEGRYRLLGLYFQWLEVRQAGAP